MSQSKPSQHPTVFVELQPNIILNEQKGRRTVEVINESKEAFGNAMLTARAAAHEVFETIQKIPLAERPDEMTLEFGLKMTVGGGVLVANARTEAQIMVSMKWQKDTAEV